MNKKVWFTSILIFSLLGVSGCAGNNRNDMTRPIGYYSNENHQSNYGNNLYSDNDGPLTEMMDHTLGDEDQVSNSQKKNMLQTRDKNGNPPNPTVPLAANDQFLKKDNRFSTGDVNYHDHLSQNINNTGTTTDPQNLGQISDRIRQKVKNVKNVQDVRSVVYGSSVLISVDLKDKNKAASTKKAIRKAVQPYVNNRAVTVITDEGTFSRDRNNQTGVRAGTK
ncbi:YhcN/YlaJ family sporulation lipoprotein [Neobacillus sp. PS3-12]|uniref:YhcN/YlaJ family sporulation lipoprotein n=1 Tax=Neobacillus sp. PS3-12 TaxID=3070677 RepID=UPI0027DFD3DA|nr:YhcN/YlaJ family sporulation lipoprotein [Neobacillus sp. PS3-12]WML54179.1 YhcN/YlaJ family sporulation lipoprotein [Neobacillus sp. PS3-12]